jgi:formate hydrogenlyase subunit 3/multisubunit Na+/H+ antiporter MnhD subunit
MVRLFSTLAALMVAATAVSLGVYGADHLFLIIQPHMHSRWLGLVGEWLGVAGGLYSAAVAVIVAMKEGRAKRDEAAPLTPIVRRLPSGLHEI